MCSTLAVFVRLAEDTTTMGRDSTRYPTGNNGPTVLELRAKCKQRGLSNYSTLSKADLVSLLEGTVLKSTFSVVVYSSVNRGLLQGVR